MKRLWEPPMRRFGLHYTPILEFAILLFLMPSTANAQQPMLIPQPREVQAKAANFAVTSDLQIALLPVLLRATVPLLKAFRRNLPK